MTQNLKIEVLTGDISIDGMVVTNLVTKEELSTAILKKADLGTDGKIPTSQLPAEIVNTAGIVDEVKQQLETSIKDAVDESNAYAESYTDNALSSKADLVSGKVPLEQLPSIDQYPQFGDSLTNLSTAIMKDMRARTDELEKTKASLGEDGKVLRELIPSYEKISGLPEQLEVMSTQTAAVSKELGEYKVQTADHIDVLKENVEANIQQLADRQSHLMRTYATKELGVDAKVGVKPGEYFYIRSTNEEEMMIECRNVGGNAVETGKSYPSTKYVALPFVTNKKYNSGERVVLTNGDIVKSTIDANTNNPNLNMMGWVKTNSASLIFDESGLSQQAINNNFVTPEMFGAVANSWETDNTAALNAAFATGKDVYSTPDKIYTCNGNLRTKGQRCVGGWKIRSSKAVVGAANWTNTSNTYATPCDYAYLQGVYCAYAYDLAELFAIRDLGYNTLLHYGGMHISGYDNDGNVQNVLDNAKTAGLQVFLGTQNGLEGMTLADYVNTYKNHPSVLGFIIADEPTHNGISVAQQKIKINQMKALTNKPVAVSDFTFDPFTEVLADGYDYIFGDIYNSENETVQQTLYKMRAWLGLTSKRHPNAKVLPTVMGFKYTGSPELGTIIETSKIFARACGGNFGCFAWDGGGESYITNSIRDTYGLQDLSREICAYKTNVYSIPECCAWGGISSQPTQVHYGLEDAFKRHVRADPYSTEGYEGVRSYPVQMNGGSPESDRISPHIQSGHGISGIWFKGTFGAYISDIHIKKYNHLTVHSGMLNRGEASVTLGVRGSNSGGYGVGAQIVSLPVDGTVETKTFEYESPFDMFCIKYDSSLNAPYYRTYVRGVYITSDW